jgi:hypothetical protein
MRRMSTSFVTPLTTKQVAARLDVSIWTVHGLVKSGKLTPLYKLDGETGAYAFDPAAVDALADEAAS